MKTKFTFAMMLVLLAFTSSIVGSAGPVVVDIVGSNADNIMVESAFEPVDLEIVGGTAKDVIVALPKPAVPECLCGNCCYPDVRCNGSEASYPWDSMHLGVDAWYGTFWYTDINMPRWPHI